MTGYSEVMDFSVEHGYSYLRILAGNEEPVCQFKLSHQGVHPTAAKAATVPKLCQMSLDSSAWVGFERKADSPSCCKCC
jgi:hypothetical protein